MRWVATAVIPLAWIVVAALMWSAWSNDPYDPSLTGTAAYGHNGEGTLATGLLVTAVETAVLLAVLRPWSYSVKEFWRPLILLPIALPWTLLSMFMTMHAGSVIVLHLFWLVAVDAALVLLAIGGGVARLAQRRDPFA